MEETLSSPATRASRATPRAMQWMDGKLDGNDGEEGADDDEA